MTSAARFARSPPGAGDEDWIDLALHYMEACKVLGRKPKVRRSKEETF